MKKKKAVLNIGLGLFSQFLIVILGFVSKKYFIHILGNDINGLNGALNTVMIFISLLELGIGSTLVIQLYKPLSESELPKIVGLLTYFKKIYRGICLATIAVAIILVPLLPYLIKGNTSITPWLFYTTYTLFILGLLVNYPYAAERALLQADQNLYILTVYDSFYAFFRLVLQLLFLFLTRNYLVFLLIDLSLHLLENELLKRKIHRKYPYILKENDYQLLESDKAIIKSSSKSLGIHKLANFLLLNSDNFFLAAFFSLNKVGLFSNYLLIISTISVFFSQFTSSLTAGFGNLLLEENNERHFQLYRMTGFINFLLTNFAGISLLILLSPFVQLWLGARFIIDPLIVLLLVVNFTISSLGAMNNTLRNAAGNFKEDRYRQLILSLLKVLFSFVGLYYWGIYGLLFSTTISLLIREAFLVPSIIYRTILNVSLRQFYKEYLGYVSVMILNGLLMTWLSQVIFQLGLGRYLQFFYLSIVTIFLPTLVTVLLFLRTRRYRQVRGLLGTTIKKIYKKIAPAHA